MPDLYLLYGIILFLPLFFRYKAKYLQVAVAVPTVLRLGDGVGAALAVILGHIFTLLEGGSLVLQNVSDTEGVAVKSPLLAQFGAIRAQGLIVNLREVYVFAFIHHVTLFLVNIS